MKQGLKKLGKTIIWLLVCIVVVITAIVTVRTFLLGSVRVEGVSMKPTIEEKGAVAYYVINGYTLSYDDIVIAYAPAESAETGVCPAEEKNSFSTFLTNYADYFKNIFNQLNKVEVSEEKEIINGYVCVIKRVVGLPGDKIDIVDGRLYVNGEEREESFLGESMTKKTGSETYGVKNGTWILEDDEYFILGDNRNVSRDSEDYGPVKSTHILGKVWMVKQKGKMITANNLK